jgi:hypothetical protein
MFDSETCTYFCGCHLPSSSLSLSSSVPSSCLVKNNCHHNSAQQSSPYKNSFHRFAGRNGGPAGKAALRENIAAGLLLLSKWDKTAADARAPAGAPAVFCGRSIAQQGEVFASLDRFLRHSEHSGSDFLIVSTKQVLRV